MAERNFQENYFLGVLGALIAVAGIGVLVSVLITGLHFFDLIAGSRTESTISGVRVGLVVVAISGLWFWGLIKFARFVQRRGVITRPGSPS